MMEFAQFGMLMTRKCIFLGRNSFYFHLHSVGILDMADFWRFPRNLFDCYLLYSSMANYGKRLSL